MASGTTPRRVMQTGYNFCCRTNTILHSFEKNVKDLHTNFEINFEINPIWNGCRVFLDLNCKYNGSDICALYAFCVKTIPDLQKLRTFCNTFEEDAISHVETCGHHECTDF